MSNPVEIVIRAVDQFTPVFSGLDAALQRADQAGQQAGVALAGVGRSFGGVAEAGAAADAALTGFVASAGERLTALDIQGQEVLAGMADQQEEAAQSLADRLLVLDDAVGAQREADRGARFAREQATVQSQHAALLALEQRFGHQLMALDATVAAARLETFRQLTASLLSLAQAHGGALARGAQALAVAEALISTYLAASKALASVPYPFNLVAAAAVTAQGLATVERIRSVHIAHGGLEQVPEDATFLLQRGERVLSAPQNRDLTRFLDPRGGEGAATGAGGVVIEQLTVHVLEHATNADALLAMDPAQLRQVVSERVIPMLDDLARLGIRPRFVTDNT